MFGIQTERSAAALIQQGVFSAGTHHGILKCVLPGITGISVQRIGIQVGIMQQKQCVIYNVCLIAGAAGDGQRKVALCQSAVVLCHRIIAAADALQLGNPHIPLYIQIAAKADDQQK